MQTALVKCYVAWPRLRAAESADAYVRKALTNTYISWRRKKSWGMEHPTEVLPDRGIGDPTADVSVRHVVMQALAQLPPRQRAVVVMRFYEDLGVEQVAAAMSCSTGTVRSQTSDALAKLRDHPRRRRGVRTDHCATRVWRRVVMTEKLRDVLLEEAGAARVPPTNLGPVLSAGGRAVRRRRIVGIGAAVAVAVLAAAVVPGVVDRAREDAPVVGTPGAWVGAWADAESLHFGEVEAPRPEHLYEMAAGSNGVVYVDWTAVRRRSSG